MGGQIVGFDLQRQPAQGTTISAARSGQPRAIAGQNGEDPLDRIPASGEGRLHDCWFEPVQVSIQYRQQQSFLAREEMVKAACVGLRPVQDFGHPGSGVTPLPEKISRRIQQPLPS